MGLESFRVSTVLPVTASRIYEAWLDGAEHSRFTGGAATVDPRVGGRHTAWDGYIEGKILDLVEGKRIVQSWRTAEFPADAADSRIEVLLREVATGTEIAILHIDIPEGQGGRYQSDWVEHYFDPMHDYFGAPTTLPAPPRVERAKPSAPKRAANAAGAKKKAKKAAAPAKKRAKRRPASASKSAPKRAPKPKATKKRATKPAKKAAKKKRR